MFHTRSFQSKFKIKNGENGSQVSISHDGSTVTAETEDNTLLILYLEDDKIINKMMILAQGNQLVIKVFALSPDGQYLATYSEQIRHDFRHPEFAIHLWDTKTGNIFHEFDWNVVSQHATTDQRYTDFSSCQMVINLRHLQFVGKWLFGVQTTGIFCALLDKIHATLTI